MSVDLARLAVEIDSTQLREGERALHGFTRAGKTAERGMLSLRTSSRQVDGQMRISAQQFDRFGRTVQNVGRNLSMFIGLPLIALGAKIAQTGMKFEAELTKINTLVGISKTELAGMETQMLALSQVSGRGPMELAQALFTVTSAGARGAEAMSVLERAAKASAIGLGETRSIAQATTAVIQAYGAENITAARATDILASTVRAGNLEAASLAPVIGRVIGLGAQLGVTFEEIGANVATFTRLGVSAEEAVTGLRGVLQTLIMPSSQAAEALESVGLSFEGLRRMVRTQGLAETMRLLMETFEGQDEALATIIPNVRALSNVLGTAGVQGEAYAQILQDIAEGHGIVDEGFQTVGDTAQLQWDRAKASLEVAMVSMRDSALPMMKQLAESVQAGAEALAGMDEQTQRNIVRFGLFAVVAGPVVSIVGRLIRTLPNLIRLFGMLRLAMIATPWGAALTVGGSLAALLAGKYISSSRQATGATNEFSEALAEQNKTLEEARKQLEGLSLQKMMDSTQNAIAITREEVSKLRKEEENYRRVLESRGGRAALQQFPDFQGFGQAKESEKLLADLERQREVIMDLNRLENRLTQTRASRGTVGQERIPGLEREIDALRESIGLTAKYTQEIEKNTQARDENTQGARQTIRVAENLFDTFEQAQQNIQPLELIDQIMLGFPASISQAEEAMQKLEKAFSEATSQDRRDELLVYMSHLQELIELMRGAKVGEEFILDLGAIDTILSGYPTSIRAAEAALHGLNEAMETTADPEKREALQRYIKQLEATISRMRGIETQTRKLDRAAQDLGFTFSSAAEQAIVSWKGFSELLQGILNDILRITTRTLVTGRLADGLSGAISGIGSGGSGGSATTESVDDALIQSNGTIVRFHPDDNLLAMKDFSKLLDEEKIAQEIAKVLPSAGSSGKVSQKLAASVSEIDFAGGSTERIIEKMRPQADTRGSGITVNNIINRPRSTGLSQRQTQKAAPSTGDPFRSTQQELVERHTESLEKSLTKIFSSSSTETRRDSRHEILAPAIHETRRAEPELKTNIQINVENHTGADVDIQQRETMDGIQITATIKETVEGLMNTGRLDRTMKKNFNINRNPARRG